ncbi:hypothetical protein AAUPMC_05912, partial [Pasteurella multocida subsp. multocida str. Anand1_cattle]
MPVAPHRIPLFQAQPLVIMDITQKKSSRKTRQQQIRFQANCANVGNQK